MRLVCWPKYHTLDIKDGIVSSKVSSCIKAVVSNYDSGSIFVHREGIKDSGSLKKKTSLKLFWGYVSRALLDVEGQDILWGQKMGELLRRQVKGTIS